MKWPADDNWTAFFAQAPPEDAAWAVHLLLGGRVKRIDAAVMRAALVETLDLPPEVVDQSVAAVKDPALAAALLFDTCCAGTTDDAGLAEWMDQRLLPLARQTPDEQIANIARWWPTADLPTAKLVSRLILGGTVRLAFERLRDALATALALPRADITHRLLTPFAPTPADWARLTAPAVGTPPSARLPAMPRVEIAAPPAGALPLIWSTPGPAAQLVKRAGEVHLWASGARPQTAMFPEIAQRAAALPDDTVLDCVLRPRVAARERLERRRLSPRMRETPVSLVVTRVRSGDPGDFTLAERLDGAPDALLAQARVAGAAGLCWLGPDADYVMAAPAREVIATLVYLQIGRRFIASFAVQRGDDWLPIAKVEVGGALYGWVKANTIERNGPVRVVPPVRRFRLRGGLEAAPRRKAKLWLKGAEIVAETDAPAHRLVELEPWLDE